MPTNVIVKPTGPYCYMDTHKGQFIESHRPSLVELSPFVETKIANQDLKLLVTGLPEEATDEEFVKAYIASGNKEDLAVASFAAEYGVDPLGNEIGTEGGNKLTPSQQKKQDEKAAKQKAKDEADAKAKADKEAAEKADADKKAADEAELQKLIDEENAAKEAAKPAKK